MIKNLFIQILYDHLRGMYNSIIITLEIQIESKSFVCFINKQMPRWNEKRGRGENFDWWHLWFLLIFRRNLRRNLRRNTKNNDHTGSGRGLTQKFVYLLKYEGIMLLKMYEFSIKIEIDMFTKRRDKHLIKTW